jgi:hypothetical protein
MKINNKFRLIITQNLIKEDKKEEKKENSK